MEITGRSKLLEVLKAYPQLEEQIIAVAPPFKNLRNPILRRTVAQLATVEQVAQIGGMDAGELVRILRRAAGLEELPAGPVQAFVPPPRAAGDPEWIEGAPAHVVDGVALLRDGIVPVQRVNEILAKQPAGAFILLTTDFKPAPIIDAMEKSGRKVYHKMAPHAENLHLTYIG